MTGVHKSDHYYDICTKSRYDTRLRLFYLILVTFYTQYPVILTIFFRFADELP